MLQSMLQVATLHAAVIQVATLQVAMLQSMLQVAMLHAAIIQVATLQVAMIQLTILQVFHSLAETRHNPA